MIEYPQLLLEENGCEIIACSPFRFRLLYQGKYVAQFKLFTLACKYMILEFV